MYLTYVDTIGFKHTGDQMYSSCGADSVSSIRNPLCIC